MSNRHTLMNCLKWRHRTITCYHLCANNPALRPQKAKATQALICDLCLTLRKAPSDNFMMFALCTAVTFLRLFKNAKPKAYSATLQKGSNIICWEITMKTHCMIVKALTYMTLAVLPISLCTLFEQGHTSLTCLRWWPSSFPLHLARPHAQDLSIPPLCSLCTGNLRVGSLKLLHPMPHSGYILCLVSAHTQWLIAAIISALASPAKLWMTPLGSQRRYGFSPDDYNVNIFMPCLYSWHAEAVHQVDMQIQLLAQLYIQALIAGIAAYERSEKSALQADLIPLDGLKDVRWHILYWIPACVTAMQLVKSVKTQRDHCLLGVKCLLYARSARLLLHIAQFMHHWGLETLRSPCSHVTRCQSWQGKIYLSQRIGALAASTTFSTALLISGPIPSPGMSVTVWILASPGLGT